MVLTRMERWKDFFVRSDTILIKKIWNCQFGSFKNKNHYYDDDEESVRIDDHVGLVRSWCGMYVVLVEGDKDKGFCGVDSDKTGIET